MLWLVRITWATLPVTAGTAISDSVASWSTGPRVVAGVLLWGTWACGLLASFVPRPVSIATLRTSAAIVFALTIIAIPATSAANAWIGIAGSVLALLSASTPHFARAGLNALAYGDEERYPLKTPPALFLGPLPIAVVAFAIGASSGPLLLADARWVLGAVACVIGLPLAVVLGRALLGLTRRMAVVVPAGLVIVDPMTLGDPCLFTQDHIARLRAVDPRERPDDTTLDTRAGAFVGALALELDDVADVLQVRPGRRGGAMTRISNLWFAPVDSARFVASAQDRRTRRVV